MNQLETLKEKIENPDFTLDNLQEEMPELKAQWHFDQRISIPILRKIIANYEELDKEDIKEMYCNPDFFDEEYDIQENQATIDKIISLIQYWKYQNHIGILVTE